MARPQKTYSEEEKTAIKKHIKSARIQKSKRGYYA